MSEARQWSLRGLYIVTPDWDDTDKLVGATEQAIQGGATLVQYRHKTADAILRKEQASALLQVCRRYNTPFIINDYVDGHQRAVAVVREGEQAHAVVVVAKLHFLGPGGVQGISEFGNRLVNVFKLVFTIRVTRINRETVRRRNAGVFVPRS